MQIDGWRSVRKEDWVDHSRGADREDQGVFWRTGRVCPITWLTEDGRGSMREEALSSALSGSPGCPMSGRIYSGGPGREADFIGPSSFRRSRVHTSPGQAEISGGHWYVRHWAYRRLAPVIGVTCIPSAIAAAVPPKDRPCLFSHAGRSDPEKTRL